MCQLDRLASFQKVPARRVGLSATLGDPQLAKDWLKGNSKLEVQLIESKGDRSLELGMEYFLLILAISLSLVVSGAGRYSLDAYLSRSFEAKEIFTHHLNKDRLRA